jgi:hypothetical protein
MRGSLRAWCCLAPCRAAECHSDPGGYRGPFLSAGSPQHTRLPPTRRATRGMMPPSYRFRSLRILMSAYRKTPPGGGRTPLNGGKTPLGGGKTPLGGGPPRGHRGRTGPGTLRYILRLCRRDNRPSSRPLRPVVKTPVAHSKAGGGEFDADELDLVQGRWDHEHCIVCYFRIEPGYTYWQNGDGLIVCDVCHQHVQAEEREEPGA